MRRRLIPLALILTVVATACGSDDTDDDAGSIELTAADATGEFGSPPVVPTGPVADAVAADLDVVFASLETDLDFDALDRLGASGDARVAWLLSDLLRFVRPGTAAADAISDAWEAVTAKSASGCAWTIFAVMP